MKPYQTTFLRPVCLLKLVEIWKQQLFKSSYNIIIASSSTRNKFLTEAVKDFETFHVKNIFSLLLLRCQPLIFFWTGRFEAASVMAAAWCVRGQEVVPSGVFCSVLSGAQNCIVKLELGTGTGLGRVIDREPGERMSWRLSLTMLSPVTRPIVWSVKLIRDELSDDMMMAFTEWT